MDIFDQATEQEEMMREHALQAALNHAPTIQAVGKCYNCNEKLRRPKLFCDADCRDDWQARAKAMVLKHG
jgi:hypothetical protein